MLAILSHDKTNYLQVLEGTLIPHTSHLLDRLFSLLEHPHSILYLDGVAILCFPLGILDFPRGSDGKESAYQCRTPGFDPWVRKIPWRKEWLLQYSCLENSMDRGAWWAIVHGIAKSQT